MKKLIIATLSLVIATTVLSACGKRGELTPPEGSKYPQQYPKQ